VTIFDRARANPDGLAVDDGDQQRTWAELVDRSTRVARFLRDDGGVAPDDHVAILMGNRTEYVEIVLGSILAGVWLTPINWHLAPDEIAYIVEDSGAKLVFCDEAYEPVAPRPCCLWARPSSKRCLRRLPSPWTWPGLRAPP